MNDALPTAGLGYRTRTCATALACAALFLLPAAYRSARADAAGAPVAPISTAAVEVALPAEPAAQLPPAPVEDIPDAAVVDQYLPTGDTSDEHPPQGESSAAGVPDENLSEENLPEENPPTATTPQENPPEERPAQASPPESHGFTLPGGLGGPEQWTSPEGLSSALANTVAVGRGQPGAGTVDDDHLLRADRDRAGIVASGARHAAVAVEPGGYLDRAVHDAV